MCDAVLLTGISQCFGGTTILHSVGNYSPHDIASHPRRPDISKCRSCM